MQVIVKLYATLSRFSQETLPGTPFKFELPEGATLQELVSQLKIPAEETRVTFVNGVIQAPEWVLKTGDEVGIFPPIGGGSQGEMIIDAWLYGELARFGGEANQGSFANPQVSLPAGSTVGDLLAYLQMPSEERGITFINGELSAMPGIQPDLDHPLKDGDRVAFFHLNSMWPFQYRFGVPMIQEMSRAMHAGDDQGLHHAYKPD
jgi:molybdopterin converting factor small subunit